jgi:hypothetical protein
MAGLSVAKWQHFPMEASPDGVPYIDVKPLQGG